MSISDEFDAWAAEQDELERRIKVAIYEEWLEQFECECGDCNAIFVWHKPTPIRWVGPCADKSWREWERYAT